MTFLKTWLLALAGVAAYAAAPAQASLVAYTSRSAFDAAIAALPGATSSTQGFDSLASGTLLPSGSGAGGITFTYGLGGVNLQVASGAPTTSPGNFLGTDDGGVLQQGDGFQMAFGPSNAIGLYLMSLDALFDDDLRLIVGSTSVSLAIADLQQTLVDGTAVYFLGLMDASAAFTSASLRSDMNGTGQFLWNADDIVTAAAQAGNTVPEPGTCALLGACVLALGLHRRRPPGKH